VGDFGEMRSVKTRRDCRCEWCGEDIPKGSDAQYFGGRWQDEWQNWHIHPECYKASILERTYMEDGFSPYEHERGTTGEKT
jgi:hypothetical protein